MPLEQRHPSFLGLFVVGEQGRGDLDEALRDLFDNKTRINLYLAFFLSFL
jgi:hypothetical protein